MNGNKTVDGLILSLSDRMGISKQPSGDYRLHHILLQTEHLLNKSELVESNISYENTFKEACALLGLGSYTSPAGFLACMRNIKELLDGFKNIYNERIQEAGEEVRMPPSPMLVQGAGCAGIYTVTKAWHDWFFEVRLPQSHVSNTAEKVKALMTEEINDTIKAANINTGGNNINVIVSFDNPADIGMPTVVFGVVVKEKI